MLTTTLTLRVLDSEGELLGWADQTAEAHGDGCLTVLGSSLVTADRSGAPAWLSIHWADVNVEWKLVLDGLAFFVEGTQVQFVWDGHVRIGPMPERLAPVTAKGSVVIDVPVGAIGVRVP